MQTIKTKQQVLNAAYGKEYAELCSWMDKVTGWVWSFTHPNVHGFETQDVDFDFTPQSPVFEKRWKWRPKSLRGLENNNGWTIVDGFDTLPTQGGVYIVISDLYPSVDDLEYGFYPDGTDGEMYISFWLKHITHWREKHSGPLYGPDKKGGQ